MKKDITFSDPEEISALYEAAIESVQYNRGTLFSRLVADKLIAAGLATKEEYRLWSNDGRGGFLPVSYYFPPGSGAALTKAAKDWLLPKPQRPKMGSAHPRRKS